MLNYLRTLRCISILLCGSMCHFFSCSNHDSNSCDDTGHDPCSISSPVIGNWKLIEECNCYTLGGDMAWRKVTKNVSMSFAANCTITGTGDTGTKCNEGDYTVEGD